MVETLFAKKAARSKAMIPTGDRFRLKNEQGLYLHYSGESFTSKINLAWWGTEAQTTAMLKRPANASLRSVPYVR